MTDEFDHEYTSEIVCPHCGYTSEWDPDNNEIFEEDCPSCEREYRVAVHHSVDFSTSIFDREAEEREAAEKKAKEDERIAAVYAACQKFPPGSRVRILPMGKGWADRLAGETGVVSNKELSKHNPFVHVELDKFAGEDRLFDNSFFPQQVEAE